MIVDDKRPEVPEDKIIEVNNTKKLDFQNGYKFIYFDLWFHLLTLPAYMICYVIVTLCRLYFGFRVEGRKNKRAMRKTGCITVSNHCHYFDTVFANYVMFPERLYVSVVQRNYEVPFVRRVLRILRAFPIPRGINGFKMITEPVGEALGRGHNVHFLPEGNLVHLSQTIHRFKGGAFYQAYLHQAPVLPMVYVIKRRKFFGKLMPPNWIKMKMVIGEAVYPPKTTEDGKMPKDELKRMANDIAAWMESVIAENHKDDK